MYFFGLTRPVCIAVNPYNLVAIFAFCSNETSHGDISKNRSHSLGKILFKYPDNWLIFHDLTTLL